MRITVKQVYYLLWIILVSFSVQSKAGTLKQVTFTPPAMLTIDTVDCTLQPAVRQTHKLILPLANCVTSSGEIEIKNNTLIKVHWAQHDPQTVWVVATFASAYQFTLASSVNPYVICLPTCHTVKSFSLAESAMNSQQLFENVEDSMFFNFHGLDFMIPLEGMLIEELIDRSIGYTPKDMIRDGLPDFGSIRDDWKGKPRPHEGYDIYTDNINVLAATAGKVIKIGKSYNAGLYVKLQHQADLYTVYVHLDQATVKEGQTVSTGEKIGTIKGASGNAVEPQLHFELKIKDEGMDPLPLIEDYYQDHTTLIEKINRYKELLKEKTLERNQKVQTLLKSYRR
jgi:hypothetical protein